MPWRRPRRKMVSPLEAHSVIAKLSAYLVSILAVASTKQTITLTSSLSAAASSTPPAVAVGELSPDVVATLVLLSPSCALSSDDVSDGSLDPLCAQEVLDINRQINARNHNSGIPSSSRHKLLRFLSRAQKRPLSLSLSLTGSKTALPVTQNLHPSLGFLFEDFAAAEFFWVDLRPFVSLARAACKTKVARPLAESHTSSLAIGGEERAEAAGVSEH